MKRIFILLFVVASVTVCAQSRHVDLYCHRTANKDVPENTLESLEMAALSGCDVIEVDVRRTMDGVLILNHDGFTERLTDGVGEVETSLYDDLATREAGAWMGGRWSGMHIVRFDDALTFARAHGVRLILDVKVKGTGADILAAVDRASMRDRVRFGGEVDDIRDRLPKQTGAPESWVQPNATAKQIDSLHRDGKRVIVNFSANAHEMDLDAMHAAVANGADGINVDYVRLGADAVGRPVEATVAALSRTASSGDSQHRLEAIALLPHFYGVPLTESFASWLLDVDPRVSRAAAVALVTMRPRPNPHIFDKALRSKDAHVQANAAWGVGALRGPSSMLVPLLHSNDPIVLEEALVALARTPGNVPAEQLLPLLHHKDTAVCGAAASALAAHDPAMAQRILPARLRLEVKETLARYDAWTKRGQPTLTETEIKTITDHYRSQMKMLQAIGSLKGEPSLVALEEQAFHPGADFTQTLSQVAGFQLWDRIADQPEDAVRQLGSSNAGVADRAEWMLTMADDRVGPAVRSALRDANPAIRQRAIRIVAFRADSDALHQLQSMREPEAVWAAEKIHQAHAALP
ncbi:glycerophosphodiester phosphodiesterase family protein [Terriglobus sp. TAA 43]|uniref:glycerophosphodiester phosphodiesterase family protein n=1 Tax=Terriglobus sp. TAA 43 TaxID=278961 RepID=UPI0006482B5C|nr:glycerophosphodiester phosphodiesterase family protein [Terriglobus sp. TAA 43]